MPGWADHLASAGGCLNSCSDRLYTDFVGAIPCGCPGRHTGLPLRFGNLINYFSVFSVPSVAVKTGKIRAEFRPKAMAMLVLSFEC